MIHRILSIYRNIRRFVHDPFRHKAMTELLRHHNRLFAEYELLKSQMKDEFTFPALRNWLVRRQCRFQTVIDIGASDGRWSAEFSESFAGAHYLLFECDPRHTAAVQAFAAARSNVDVVLAAASDSDQPLSFCGETPDSGRVHHRPHSSASQSVPATTIATEVKRRNLPGPYFLKLDVHGFEQSVLRGAEPLFNQVEFILLEVYNFNLGNPDCLRFPQMCQLLEGKGFRPVYFCDPLARPSDGCLFQFDLLFARTQQAPEFKSEGWP